MIAQGTSVTRPHSSGLMKLAMPADAALQQLKIECFYPADDATAEIARELAT